MIDEQSEQVLAKLYPPFAEKLRQLISVLGENWRVNEGFRSFDEQGAYFAQGRSRPGALITRDRAGYSGRCYGTVASLVPSVEGSVVRDNAAFLQLATEAQSLGLQWGGTDTTGKFVEMSRVEMVILSMDECLALFKTGGLSGLWAAFDAKIGVVKEEVVPEVPIEEVAAEPEIKSQAEEAVESTAAEPETVEAAPEVPVATKPDSPVVARKKKVAAKKKGK